MNNPKKYKAVELGTGKKVEGWFVESWSVNTDAHDQVIGYDSIPCIFNNEPGARGKGSYWHAVDINTLEECIDWEQRRYEIAKKVLPQSISIVADILMRGGSLVEDTAALQAAETAIQYADALIEKLKTKKMNKEEIKKYLSEKLRIYADFEEPMRGDMKKLVITLSLEGETINEAKLWI